MGKEPGPNRIRNEERKDESTEKEREREINKAPRNRQVSDE
jgi:hypothetical protein